MKATSLLTEVGLLQKRCPQFLDHFLQVEHLVVFHETRRLARHDAHDVDVLRHGGLHARALNLHGNDVAVGQARFVHLRKRSAAQRLRVDGIEDLALFITVDVMDSRENLVKGQRIALHLQLGELVAKRLGKNL